MDDLFLTSSSRLIKDCKENLVVEFDMNDPVIFPFLVSPTTGLGWISRVRSRQITGTDWCYQWAQGLFGGVLRSIHGVRWHSLDIFHHPRSLAFVLVHSDKFQKFELFWA